MNGPRSRSRDSLSVQGLTPGTLGLGTRTQSREGDLESQKTMAGGAPHLRRCPRSPGAKEATLVRHDGHNHQRGDAEDVGARVLNDLLTAASLHGRLHGLLAAPGHRGAAERRGHATRRQEGRRAERHRGQEEEGQDRHASARHASEGEIFPIRRLLLLHTGALKPKLLKDYHGWARRNHPRQLRFHRFQPEFEVQVLRNAVANSWLRTIMGSTLMGSMQK